MRIVDVVFIYTGAFLCRLPACSSVVTCNITLDRSVYAFPSRFISDLTSTSSAYSFHGKVDIQLDEQGRVCRNKRDDKNTFAVLFNDYSITFKNWTTEVSTELNNVSFHQINFTVDSKIIFDTFKAKIGVAKFFYAYYVEDCDGMSTRDCSVTVKFVQDNPPTVVFKTMLNATPRKWINGTSDLNGTSSHIVEVEIETINSNVEVHIEVNDNDFFVDNPDKFEYCAVSEPIITFSAVVTFYNFSQNSNNHTPYNQPLATNFNQFNKDQNKIENAWWVKRSLMINETLSKVQFDFKIVTLCSAINSLLSLLNKSSNLSHERSLEAIVNLTLDVTAISGRTNQQKSLTKYILLLPIKGKMLSDSDRSLSDDTVSTTSEKNNAAASNLVAVVCITMAVILLLVFGIFLLCKFRHRILRSYTSRPVPDGSGTAGALETCCCFTITASSDRKRTRKDIGLDNRQGELVAEVSAEVTTSLIEAKHSDGKPSASAT